MYRKAPPSLSKCFPQTLQRHLLLSRSSISESWRLAKEPKKAEQTTLRGFIRWVSNPQEVFPAQTRMEDLN